MIGNRLALRCPKIGLESESVAPDYRLPPRLVGAVLHTMYKTAQIVYTKMRFCQEQNSSIYISYINWHAALAERRILNGLRKRVKERKGWVPA